MRGSQSELVGKIDESGDYNEGIANALHAAIKGLQGEQHLVTSRQPPPPAASWSR